jgi:mannose-6-phosphate isomerase-like protein (cupin superfamily)
LERHHEENSAGDRSRRVGSGFSTLVAQNPQAGRGGTAETWWVNKTKGGVYNPPMRPLWKLAELKQMHAGQNSWQEQIIKDPEQDATYNSAAPGTKFTPRLHPDTPSVFVVIAGEVRFTVEGQQPVTATRGSIVNIMKTTTFSYEVAGNQNALWVEVNPTNFKTAYPSSGRQPPAANGGQVVKVAFSHTPAPYAPPNRLHWNLFDDGFAKCDPTGPKVMDDHLYASPLIGYPLINMNNTDGR